MALVKTAVVSGLATFIKVISAFVINKIVSVYVGPSGLALIGQLQNFSQLATTIADGAISNGVTKYTAEYGEEDRRLPLLFSTAIKISFACSALASFGLIIFSSQLSEYFLKTERYSYIFIVFGFTIVLFVMNNILISIVNGLKEISLWAKINITQSVYGLIFTSLLVIFFGLDGALLALVTNQSVIFFIIIWFLWNHKIIKFSKFKELFNRAEAKKLAAFSLMAFTTAATLPVSQLIVRNHIGSNLSWTDAGYWQAIMYISTMYLLVVTSALGVYYLPRLSEINDKSELRKELMYGYALILPVVFIMGLAIFLLKDQIIIIVFTKDFVAIRELFLWQLIGDFIKLAAWLISYLMIAKAMTKAYVTTEILFSVNYVVLSVIFVDSFGLVGVTYAFSLNYFMYFLTMVVITRKYWI